jgi:tetratricopeptide (TPR) repeat protein
MQEEGKKQTEKAKPPVAESNSADSVELKESTGGAHGAFGVLPVVQDGRDPVGKQLEPAGKNKPAAPLSSGKVAPPQRPTRNDKAQGSKPKRRRRRAADLLIAIALDLVLIPLAIGATKLVIDPAALPTAKAACIASPDHGVGYLTQALAVRNDSLLRFLRAEANITNQKYADAESDLSDLVETKPCIARTVPLDLAALQIRRGAYNNATSAYLLEVSSPHGLGLDDGDWYLCAPEAIRDFVIGGDFVVALEAMGRRVSVDLADMSDRSLYQPPYSPTTKGIALEEIGNSQGAAEVFGQIFSKASSKVSAEERLDYAMWLLNGGHTSAAREEINTVNEIVNDPNSDYHAPCNLSVELDLINGWCFLDEGRLDRALTAADKVLAVGMADLGTDSFLTHDLMTMSAHRLRAVIFLRQGNSTQSRSESKLAGSGAIPVNIFVPKAFR